MKVHTETILQPTTQSFLVRQFKQSSFDHPFHCHPEFELTCILQSTGTRIVGDHIGTFESGDLCLIGGNLPHIYRNHRNSGDVAISEVLHFSRDFACGVLDGAPELRAFSDLLDAAARGFRFDTATFHKVSGLLPRLRKSHGIRRWILFFELVGCLLEAPRPQALASPGYGNVADTAASRKMRAVCQYILEHFDEDLSHATLARKAGTTPAYFSRLFKKTTRKTYRQFVNEVRLGHACRLLTETNLPITEIAFSCGFNNLSSFNRRFLETHRRTPGAYRQECRIVI